MPRPAPIFVEEKDAAHCLGMGTSDFRALVDAMGLKADEVMAAAYPAENTTITPRTTARRDDVLSPEKEKE